MLKKINKKGIKLINFIKHQINVEIGHLVTLKHSGRNYIDIEWSELNHTNQKLIIKLSYSYSGKYYTLMDNGGLGMVLMFGEKIKQEN